MNNEYLKTRFSEYFPQAHIDVTFHATSEVLDLEGESIEVTVSADAQSDPDYTFVMLVGSDDDWYSFTDGDLMITIPLEPED